VKVGFVAGKTLGNAVVRNRTKRRLRALAGPLVRQLLPGTRVVVRANPAAASATSDMLRRDLESAMRRAAPTASVQAVAP
jgi:ribonuclease P protein component